MSSCPTKYLNPCFDPTGLVGSPHARFFKADLKQERLPRLSEIPYA